MTLANRHDAESGACHRITLGPSRDERCFWSITRRRAVADRLVVTELVINERARTAYVNFTSASIGAGRATGDPGVSNPSRSLVPSTVNPPGPAGRACCRVLTWRDYRLEARAVEDLRSAWRTWTISLRPSVLPTDTVSRAPEPSQGRTI